MFKILEGILYVVVMLTACTEKLAQTTKCFNDCGGLRYEMEHCAQSSKSFGKCSGVTQVQPAYRIDIIVVNAKQGTDQVGEFTQLMIGDRYMKEIPGHYAIEMNAFIQEMVQKGFAFIDVHRYSQGGYLLTARNYANRCENGILVDPCNLANRDKPLGKMKTNRDRENEGCEWAKGNKPLRKMKTKRNRDNEGCEWAKEGKRLKKTRTSRDRENEGCEWAKGGKRKPTPRRLSPDIEGCELAIKPKRLKSKRFENRQSEGCPEASGKIKRKVRPARQKNQGCENRYFGKSGGKHRRNRATIQGK